MRSGCPGLLYGNNLALVWESPKVLKGKLEASEGALKSEGSNTTTIMMISREMARRGKKTSKFPCVIYRKGSRSNSILYQFWRVRYISDIMVLEVNLKSDSHLQKKFKLFTSMESPLKMMKNAFYFILKALFILKIFKFLSWHFGHVGKTAWLER